MAKKKTSDGDVNKSEELRKYLRQHPEAGAATIIPEFADRGIEITRSLVSWVKQDMKKKPPHQNLWVNSGSGSLARL